MPLYEYTCGRCGGTTEHLVGVGSDQPDLVCLACGSANLRRRMSVVSVPTGARAESCCGRCEGADYEGGGCDGGCACGS